MTSNINKGMYILFKGEPHIVLDRLFTTQGRVAAFNKTKLKSLITGKVLGQTFKSTDKVEEIQIDTKTMQFLYVDGENAIFMDPQTFEQISLPVVGIPEGRSYLHSDAKYVMMIYDGNPISVQLPKSIKLEVVNTTSAVAGNTATGATKDAELETGVTIQVPLFMKIGDKIVVNTDSGSYVSKSE